MLVQTPYQPIINPFTPFPSFKHSPVFLFTADCSPSDLSLTHINTLIRIIQESHFSSFPWRSQASFKKWLILIFMSTHIGAYYYAWRPNRLINALRSTAGLIWSFAALMRALDLSIRRLDEMLHFYLAAQVFVITSFARHRAKWSSRSRIGGSCNTSSRAEQWRLCLVLIIILDRDS